MNRKLRHPSLGFSAIAGLMAMGMLVVLAARPAIGSGQHPALVGTAAAGAEVVATSALAAALRQAGPAAGSTDSSPSRPTRKTTHRRQSLLMPYFSFASRD